MYITAVHFTGDPRFEMQLDLINDYTLLPVQFIVQYCNTCIVQRETGLCGKYQVSWICFNCKNGYSLRQVLKGQTDKL